MKKRILMVALALGVGLHSEADAQIINASIAGPAFVCPGQVNNTYTSSTNFSGLNYMVVFTCGGLGTLQSSGTQTDTIFNTGNNNSVVVDWGNFSGQSWVQVTYHWWVLSVHYTASDVQYVDVNVVIPPILSGVTSICADDVGNYTHTVTNTFPTGAYGYNWTVTNAAVVAGGGPNDNYVTWHSYGDPYDVMIELSWLSYCGGTSAPMHVIIHKEPLPLGANYPLSYIESMGGSNQLFVGLTFPNISSAYTWEFTVTEPGSPPSPTQTGTVSTSAPSYTTATLANVTATLNVLAYHANAACGNYWNYERRHGGLYLSSHNRMAHFDNETGEVISLTNVYPNPAKDELNISYYNQQAAGSVALVLTDMLGREVMKENIALNDGENQYRLSVSELPAGIYLLSVGNQEKRKVVVEK